MIEIEICINSDTSASLSENVEMARLGGAARIELCGAMHFDGLTPTPEQIKVARAAFTNVPGLMVMVRPRGGDFNFSQQEIELMVRQIDSAAENGANGVVVGVLNNDDSCIDMPALRRLVHAAFDNGLSVTVHRASDATPDPLAALDELMDAGVHRVLTSGVGWGESGGAVEGISQLQKIVAHATNIEIVIGGGIFPGNANKIIENVVTPDRKISLHAYSGVLVGDSVSKNAVLELVEAGSNSLTSFS